VDSWITGRVGKKMVGLDERGLIRFAEPSLVVPVLPKPWPPRFDCGREVTSDTGGCDTLVNTSCPIRWPILSVYVSGLVLVTIAATSPR